MITYWYLLKISKLLESHSSRKMTKSMIYVICLVGSDANDNNSKGLPRDAISIFDVKSEMEFEGIENIVYLSVHDLLHYYQEQTGKDGKRLNVFQLALFFMERHPHGHFMLDEVPLIKNGKSNTAYGISRYILFYWNKPELE